MSPRPLRTMRKIWPHATAVFSGMLLSLAYPRWSVEGMAWLWMIPLLWALWFGGPDIAAASSWKRARFGFLAGYLSGASFFLLNLSWIHTVSSLGAVLLALYLAIYFGLWGAFAATVGRPRDGDLVSEPAPDNGQQRLAPATKPSNPGRRLFATSFVSLKFAFFNAAAWAATEYLRGVLFTGFSWNGLGVGLHENLMLIQVADIIGVTGLSFLLMFCGCIAVATIRRLHLEFRIRTVRPHLDFAVAVVLVILVIFYGLTQTTRPAGAVVPVRSLIVQLNTPIAMKWDPDHMQKIYREYFDLTSLYAETSDFDLVIWPETALQMHFHHPVTVGFLNELLDKGDFNLVLGSEEFASPTEYYNSVAVVKSFWDNHRIHRKIHLVPFGEYLPLRHSFPPFEWVAGRLVPGDFTAGTSFEPIQIEDPDVSLIPLICFEDTLGDLVRRFVRPGPQLMVNVTNDAWFLESQAAEQHLANARFRCVELKRPMVRAANTGVSCYIDHVGSLYDRTRPGSVERKIYDPESGSIFITGCLPETIEVPANPPITFYARHGDLFSQVLLGWVAVLLAFRSFRGRRRALASANSRHPAR